jgi:hypothetical protein
VALLRAEPRWEGSVCPVKMGASDVSSANGAAVSCVRILMISLSVYMVRRENDTVDIVDASPLNTMFALIADHTDGGEMNKPSKRALIDGHARPANGRDCSNTLFIYISTSIHILKHLLSFLKSNLCLMLILAQARTIGFQSLLDIPV